MQDATSTPQAPTLRTRILHNTLILLAGRGIVLVIGVGTSILLARHLGSELLGQYGAIYAYLSLFNWLASLTIDPVLAREASRDRSNASSIITTGAAICAISSLGAAIFAVFLAPHVGYGGKLWVFVFFGAIDVLLLNPLRLGNIIFQVDLKQWYGVRITVARQFFWFLVVLLLSYLKAPFLFFILGRTIGAVLEVGLIILYSRRFLPPPRQIIKGQLLPFFRASVPIALSSLLASVYLRIDQVMLHSLSSDKVLGLYVAAVKVSELFEMVPAALLSSLFPVLAESNQDEERFHHFVDRIFRYMMILSGGLAIFISVGASLIVKLLYGAEFAYSAHLLRILIWSEFAIFFAAVVVNVLLAGNLQKYLVYPTALGAALNVAINLIVIPRYGAAGAAWATLVSYTLAWMVFLLVFRQTRSIIWRGLRLAVPIAGISGAVALVASKLPVSAWISVVPAVAVYAACLWGFRFMSAEDVEYVRSAIYNRRVRSKG